MPTILDLAGIDGTAIQGKSLLRNDASLSQRPVFSGISNGSRAIRWGRYKFIRDGSGAMELYDLANDPNELNDIRQQVPTIARSLRIVMATFVAYEESWSTPRWGEPSAPLEAFASDQGM
ncbi:MAG: hypothetical protein JKY56_25540 [Kofleriaceae bacterium]|nr:hypothetical protein [Kofleriaceae bacterium]